jgi:hypothetical protein
MPDADCAAHVMRVEQRRQILAECAPVVWRCGLVAAAMPAHVDREAALIGEMRDDFIPTAPVKACRVNEYQWWLCAGPFPQSEPHVTRLAVYEFWFSEHDNSCAYFTRRL